MRVLVLTWADKPALTAVGLGATRRDALRDLFVCFRAIADGTLMVRARSTRDERQALPALVLDLLSKEARGRGVKPPSVNALDMRHRVLCDIAAPTRLTTTVASSIILPYCAEDVGFWLAEQTADLIACACAPFDHIPWHPRTSYGGNDLQLCDMHVQLCDMQVQHAASHYSTHGGDSAGASGLGDPDFRLDQFVAALFDANKDHHAHLRRTCHTGAVSFVLARRHEMLLRSN